MKTAECGPNSHRSRTGATYRVLGTERSAIRVGWLQSGLITSCPTTRPMGGPKPPPIDHQGINDAFLEKASSVHYFHEGKWLRLTDAD